MAIDFPANPGAQTPVNTFSPTSTPEANTTNSVTFLWDGTKWTAAGTGGGSAALWQRDAGTSTLSPVTADDNIDQGAGDITTTGDVSAAAGTFSGNVSAGGGGGAVGSPGTTLGANGAITQYRSTSTATDLLFQLNSDVGSNRSKHYLVYANGDLLLSDADISDPANDFKVKLWGGGFITADALSGTGNRALYSNGAGTITNSSSDVSLKTNVSTLSDQSQAIKALRPVSFNWIDTKARGEQQEIGFIAQEVEQVVPQVVGINHDGTKSVDYSKLTATLTSALQTALTRIEALEADNASLEARLTALEAN